MTRVCHVLFEHGIFDGRIFHKEAVSLAQAGYEVVLLVPRLPGGWLGRKREHRLSAGESLVRAGVRFETYPYRKWVPRAFGLRNAVCRRDLLAALQRLRPDLCHFHEDGLTMEVAAALKDSLPSTRLVFDYHEFFLHRLRASDRKRRGMARFAATENRLLARADGLVTVSDFISDYYRTLTDRPVVTVMNCQSAETFPAAPAAPAADDTFRVVHEGRMLFDRGLRVLVEAARRIESPRVRFLLIGDLARSERAWFDAETRRHGIADRFEVTGMLPYLEVPERLRRGSAGVCLIEGANGLTGIPNKFFNYLRYGLPVLTLEHPILGPMVRNARCGEVLPRADAAGALARAIDRLAAEPAATAAMSRAAASLFANELNWERMSQRLLGLYRALLSADAR
ncbi:MAG TPA: glycosyltransferase [Gemmatimonadales bacterium]|nr:glycosyltransferase [Gemmatimonadales bacterium]